MSAETHRPRVGDKVWDRQRFEDAGEECNGKIIYVDWSEQEVMVRFENSTTDTFSFDDLEGKWEHILGGIYMLYPHKIGSRGR